jgi:hypothetical protein
MKNMTKLTMLVGAVIASAVCVQQAQATLVESGSSALNTFVGADAPQDNLSVNWSVTLSGSTYTYSYTVVNPSSDSDYVDSYNVTFNTVAPGAYIASSATGGIIAPAVASSSITWDITQLLPGTSTTVTYESLLPPTLGNDNASDAVPPSPWASTAPGGQLVPIPTIPDGGLTVALLGGSLVALQAVRRKFQS